MKEDSLLDAVQSMIREVVGKAINFGLSAGEGAKSCCEPTLEGPNIDFRRLLPKLNESLFNSFDECESFKDAKFPVNGQEETLLPCRPWTYLV